MLGIVLAGNVQFLEDRSCLQELTLEGGLPTIGNIDKINPGAGKCGDNRGRWGDYFLKAAQERPRRQC